MENYSQAPKVYVCAFDTHLPIGTLPFAERQKEIDQCTDFITKAQKYYAWKLLEYATIDYTGINVMQLNPTCRNGRWKFDNVYVSISHSNNVVAIAISNSAVGIDVQAIDDRLTDKLAERVLTAKERNVYDTAQDKRLELAKLWTSKEALFKKSAMTDFAPSTIDTTTVGTIHYSFAVGETNYVIATTNNCTIVQTTTEQIDDVTDNAMDQISNKFAERLYALRKRAKLKQSDLAKALHTTQRKVSYWESGKIQPDLNTIIKICNFFGVSADHLIGRN